MALNVPDQNVLSSPHLQQMMWSRSLLRGYEEAVGDTSNETCVTMTGLRGSMHPSVSKGGNLEDYWFSHGGRWCGRLGTWTVQPQAPIFQGPAQ